MPLYWHDAVYDEHHGIQGGNRWAYRAPHQAAVVTRRLSNTLQIGHSSICLLLQLQKHDVSNENHDFVS